MKLKETAHAHGFQSRLRGQAPSMGCQAASCPCQAALCCSGGPSPEQSVPLLLQLPTGNQGSDPGLACSTAASAETWATAAVPCPDPPSPTSTLTAFSQSLLSEAECCIYWQFPVPTKQSPRAGLPAPKLLTEHCVPPQMGRDTACYWIPVLRRGFHLPPIWKSIAAREREA